MNWDFPVFKVLANNDTGAAKGHQGGIVVPKDLSPYFPELSLSNDALTPTSEIYLDAELFVEGQYLGRVRTRYQHQTWGGTRSPERRLTDQLGPLRNLAKGGDLLLIQRSLDTDQLIRLRLVRQSSPEFEQYLDLISSTRWGVLSDRPVSSEDYLTANNAIDDLLDEGAGVFRDTAEKIETRTSRIARDKTFRNKVIEAYSYKCAVTKEGWVTPNGLIGLDAAHIIPVEKMGSDHPSNGIPLVKNLHWAFDRGMISFAENRTLIVSTSAKERQENTSLVSLEGMPLIEPIDQRRRASLEALNWHRDNVFSN